jgi:hypothetical protein
MLLLSTQFVACHNSGTPVVNDPYYGWYDQYGFECGNLRPGCNYWFPTGNWQDKIHADEDPYYYSNYAGDFEYYSSYYYGGTYYYDVWVSRTGIVYDSWSGDALNKANDFASGRDVITDVAVAEEKALQSAGSYYATKFGLSDDQGLKIAKTLNDFATLQSRSEQDIADFTQRLYGVNFNTLKPALDAATLGDNQPLEAVIDEAAQNFGTSPETMRGVVKSLHNKLLDEAGINL